MNDFEGAGSTGNVELKKAAIIWGVASSILAALPLIFNNSPIVLGASFLAKCVAFVVAAPLGLVGAMIGDAFRKFAAPDFVFTSGMGAMVWQKIFWLIGPQTIGCMVGVGLGAALVLG